MAHLTSSEVSGNIHPRQGVCGYCDGEGVREIFVMKEKAKRVEECPDCKGTGLPPEETDADSDV